MSNLGRYQDIVTDAKRAGGVDALIQIIEDTAVAGKRPTLVGLGFGSRSSTRLPGRRRVPSRCATESG